MRLRKDGALVGKDGHDIVAASFDDVVRARASRDPKFRRALLCEAMDCLLGGDVGPAKSMLRNYINATIGFEGLSQRTKLPSKSLMRMLSRTGNPQAQNLCTVLVQLQRVEGIRLQTTAVLTSKRRRSPDANSPPASNDMLTRLRPLSEAPARLQSAIRRFRGPHRAARRIKKTA